jgi:hypothetical protein
MVASAESGGIAENWRRFVELPYFRAKWLHLGFDDDDLRALQIMLTAAPDRWPAVRGTGGLRKMRFARVGGGRGKSGAYRVGYVHFSEFGVIGLIAVYAKNDQAEIPESQKPLIKKAIGSLREWVAANS